MQKWEGTSSTPMLMQTHGTYSIMIKSATAATFSHGDNQTMTCLGLPLSNEVKWEVAKKKSLLII